MKQKKLRTMLFTPMGKAVQTVGLTMLWFAIFGFLLVKLTSWINVSTNDF